MRKFLCKFTQDAGVIQFILHELLLLNHFCFGFCSSVDFGQIMERNAAKMSIAGRRVALARERQRRRREQLKEDRVAAEKRRKEAQRQAARLALESAAEISRRRLKDRIAQREARARASLDFTDDESSIGDSDHTTDESDADMNFSDSSVYSSKESFKRDYKRAKRALPKDPIRRYNVVKELLIMHGLIDAENSDIIEPK